MKIYDVEVPATVLYQLRVEAPDEETASRLAQALVLHGHTGYAPPEVLAHATIESGLPIEALEIEELEDVSHYPYEYALEVATQELPVWLPWMPPPQEN